MAYVSLESLFNKEENEKNETGRYKIVLTAAMRANQLAQGSRPLIETKSKKVSTIALKELAADKVRYVEVKGQKS